MITQGQINDTILCPPHSQKTFVLNIFFHLAYYTRYLRPKIKMAYPVYRNPS